MSKPQRRKGNAKAASSAQAAHLIGSGAHSFIGFDGGFTNVFHAAEAIDDISALDIDSEFGIVFKKLSKKDPQTREKALRELLDLCKNKDINQVDSCFTHFVTIYYKLAFDGSPTVRLFANKLIGFMICSLKKSAQKHLKKVLPVVFVSGCDQSASVGSQADSVLVEAVADETKILQVTTAVAPDAVRLALEILTDIHSLSVPQKYDEEETVQQRQLRLYVQCLSFIAKTVKAQKNDNITSVVDDFLGDVASIKRLLKSGNAVAVSLLKLCQDVREKRDSSCHLMTDYMTSFVMSNLDSPDPALCVACFNALINIAGEDRFYDLNDVKKKVIPRMLNVVRKKENHWRVMGPYLLPSFAMLVSHMSEEDSVVFARSFLKSFTDNLPFASAPLMSEWVGALVECVKCALSREVAQHVAADVIPLVVSSMDLVLNETIETQKVMGELVQWIVDRDVFLPIEKTQLVDCLVLNLVNRMPEANSIICSLVSSCSSPLKTLHRAAFRFKPLEKALIPPLAIADDEYLEFIDQTVNLVNLLIEECSNEGDNYATVVSRMLQISPERIDKIKFATNAICRGLLCLSADDDSLLASLLKSTNLKIVLPELIVDLSNNKKDDAVIKLLRFIGNDMELIDKIVSCAKSKNNHKIIVLLLRCEHMNFSQNTSTVEEAMVNTILNAAVTSGDFSEIEHVLNGGLGTSVAVKWTEDFLSTGQLQRQEEENDEFVDMSIGIEDVVQVLRYLARRNLHGVLPSDQTLLEIKKKLDEFLAASVIGKTGLTVADNCDDTSRELKISTLISLIAKLERYFFFITSLSLEDLSDYSVTWIAIVVSLKSAVDEVKDLLPRSSSIQLSRILLRGDRWLEVCVSDLPRVLKALILLETPTSLELNAIRHLWDVVADRTMELPSAASTVPVRWALKNNTNTNSQELNTIDRWITRLHCEDTALDFVSHLQQFAANDNELLTDLFHIRPPTAGLRRLSVGAMTAIRSVLETRCPDELDSALLDFVVCGLITALDSSECSICEDESLNQEELGFLSSVLETVALLASQSSESKNVEYKDEWDGFIEPAVTQIVTRLFVKISKLEKDEYVSWLPSLCKAVCKVRYVDAERLRSLVDDVDPELDHFLYPGNLQCLVLAAERAVNCDCSIIAQMGSHFLQILSVLMYKSENEEWKDDEEKIASGPRRVRVPLVLERLIRGANAPASIFALAAVIVPIETCVSGDEERVALCEALAPVISPVLPRLLDHCPVEPGFNRDKVLLMETTDRDLGLVAFRTTYRILCTLPAVVRLWYKGLAHNISTHVSKYVQKHMSRLVIDSELNKVKAANRTSLKEDKMLKIRVIPVNGEVVAEYIVEETTMKLSIVLPPDYPLSVPSVQLDKAVVPNERAKKWLLQLTAYLFHQNGSMVEGIVQWRRNVDRDVEGAEQCTVCMMTIHSHSHQLPKVKCKQCRNKFHSNCLPRIMRVDRVKTKRGKRVLENRAPKTIENDKVALIVRGGKTSEVVTEVLKDLAMIKKPLVKVMKRRNPFHPFEDVTPIERFASKFDASIFAFGSHSKKRSHNLVLGRLHDGNLLDMIELRITRFQSAACFDAEKMTLGSKPCLIFEGTEFDTDPEMKRVANLFVDWFRGPVLDTVRLQGLETVISFTCHEGEIFMRVYRTVLKKSATSTPRVELEEMGPSLNFLIERKKLADDALFKAACRRPKALMAKRRKNLSEDVFGNQLARVHIGKQSTDAIQTRKVKALRKTREVAGADSGNDGGDDVEMAEE